MSNKNLLSSKIMKHDNDSGRSKRRSKRKSKRSKRRSKRSKGRSRKRKSKRRSKSRSKRSKGRSRKSKRRSRKSKRRSKGRSKGRSKSKGKLKLVKIVKSPNKKKKYRAYFSTGKHTDFGAAGMSDFTKHKDPERMKRYLNRHKSRENWRDPTTAGSLSRYVLWNKTSFRASVADYKRKFKL